MALNKKSIKKQYNCLNKNRVRMRIIEEIRKRDINSILTLESPSFLFSNLLPDKKIIVFENDGNVMQKLRKNCPKNVDLIFGNISKFEIFNSICDCIYLDFCRTWMSEQENIVKLKDSLKKTRLFILTLCLRESKFHKNNGFTFEGDYQFDLVNKIQSLTGLNWRIVYGESYYDSMQMVTIIFENGGI